jgi:hypothetical protein
MKDFIETLKAVGSVKPCGGTCEMCSGTGYTIDLTMLLAKPEVMEVVVEQLHFLLPLDTRPIMLKAVSEADLVVIGPQRAPNLVYEVARQLGGTAVVAEPEYGVRLEDKLPGNWIPCVDGYRLSLPIPPDATVLLATDRTDDKEIKAVINLVTKPGNNTHTLPYVLALISDKQAIDGFKVISLHQEKP